MNQKIEFAMKALHAPDFRALCREYGISTKTGYKWRARFLARGVEGLEDQSRRPHSSPGQLAEPVVCELIRLKHAHPTWGPEKIQELYHRDRKGDAPSLSSVKRVLERAGLVRKRRVRRAADGGRIHHGRKATGPNEVWSVDFKGWWPDLKGERCEPLTIRDEYTRYILGVDRLQRACTEEVRASFERVFERHGLPEVIRSDNGPPFAAWGSLLGLSRLSVWWLALGIELERSRPGCPQDNGAHERMHLDIQRELRGFESTQSAFDIWRDEFNHVRPHKALNNRVPADLYRNSDRPFQGTPEEIDYSAMTVRKVRKGGMISWNGRNIFLSTALSGWTVGIRSTAERDEVYFANQYLGYLDEPAASLIRAGTGPDQTGDPEPKV